MLDGGRLSQAAQGLEVRRQDSRGGGRNGRRQSEFHVEAVRLGAVRRGTAVPPIGDETSSGRVQVIEVGPREAETGPDGTPGRPVGALGEGRGLEPEGSRARAGVPQEEVVVVVVRRREGEGTAVPTRVQQPGPQLAIWTDMGGVGVHLSENLGSKVDGR